MENSNRFTPPLSQRRRAFLLSSLRREQVKSLLEIGCSTGELIQALCEPALHVDDFPPLLPPDPSEVDAPSSSSLFGVTGSSFAGPSSLGTGGDVSNEASRRRKRNLVRSIERDPAQDNELHLSRVAALDIDRRSIDQLARLLQSRADSNPSGSVTACERWEDLRLEVWEGSLEVYNGAFDGLDAIVASEIIEHLSEHTLAKFAPTVFDVYSPRLVVVTTPNHSFNPWFDRRSPPESRPGGGMPEPAPRSPPPPHGKNLSSSSEGSSDSDTAAATSATISALHSHPHLFPDPTGRTKRVFRDADHKFEWTEEEFRRWAFDVADRYDYDLEITGVGSLSDYYGGRENVPNTPPSADLHPALNASSPSNSTSALPLVRYPDRFFATQTAIFTRRYPNESERSPRSHHTSPLPFFSPLAPMSSPLMPASAEMAPAPTAPVSVLTGHGAPKRPPPGSRGTSYSSLPGELRHRRQTSSASTGHSHTLSGTSGRATNPSTSTTRGRQRSYSPALASSSLASSISSSGYAIPRTHELVWSHTYPRLALSSPASLAPVRTAPTAPSDEFSPSSLSSGATTHVSESALDAADGGVGARVRALLARHFVHRARQERLSVHVLWLEAADVRRACAGYIGELIDALIEDTSDEWDLETVSEDSDDEEGELAEGNAVSVRKEAAWPRPLRSALASERLLVICKNPMSADAKAASYFAVRKQRRREIAARLKDPLKTPQAATDSDDDHGEYDDDADDESEDNCPSVHSSGDDFLSGDVTRQEDSGPPPTSAGLVAGHADDDW